MGWVYSDLPRAVFYLLKGDYSGLANSCIDREHYLLLGSGSQIPMPGAMNLFPDATCLLENASKGNSSGGP